MASNKYLVVFNPVKSHQRKSKLNKLIHFLHQQHIDFDLYPTEAAHSANLHYFEHHIHNYSDLIAVGGDGTFHNVINCLPQGSAIRVGLIPAGTGNDFSRWLYGKHINDIEHIMAVVTGSDHISIKLGCCEFNNGKQTLFHNVLGFGFDSMLAKELKHSKGMFQSLGYMLKAIQKIPFYKEKSSQVVIEGQQHDYFNLVTAIANSEYFGGGLKVAPNAFPTDTNPMLCRIERLPIKTKLTQILRLFNGSHVTKSFTDYRAISEPVVIKSEGLDIQADGEYIGQSPATISFINNAVKIKRSNRL